MTFRPVSLHKECTQCVRHKSLIQGLGQHLHARAAAQKLYYAHLRAQFLDRHEYWAVRGRSRLRGNEISLIADGMDQGKFSVPRHPQIRAAAFDTWIRPKLHVSVCIAHGYHVIVGVSDADLKKDANTSIEMLCHSLTKLSHSGVKLEESRINLQCDNTSRELKNNVCMRWAASLVSAGVLGSFTLSALRSGHSHEDIDQFHGSLAKFLVRCRIVETSQEYVDKIHSWLQSVPRPFEAERACVKIDQTRDWLRA